MSNPYKGHAMEAIALKGTLIEHGLLSCADDAAGWLMQALERAYAAGLEAAAVKAEARAKWHAERARSQRGEAALAIEAIAVVLRILADDEIRAMKGAMRNE